MGDQGFALKLRDLIKNICAEQINKLRPAYRYGTVVEVNGNQVAVRFAEQEAPVWLPVWGTTPAVDAVVRVSGLPGDKYVEGNTLGSTTGGTAFGAVLAVSPTAGFYPFTVTADASASTALLPIRDYTFDWGDGNTTGPQADATATHQYTTDGTFAVRVTVTDSANVSTSATKTVTSNAPAATGVDLIVTAITLDPAAPIAGDEVTFEVTVKNNGDADIPLGQNIGVGFYVDGVLASYTNYRDGLAGGDSYTLDSVSGWAFGGAWTAVVGAHTARAWVDDAGLITELDNGNNTKDKAFVVQPEPASTEVIDHGSTSSTSPGTTLDSTTFTPTAGTVLVAIIEGTTE